MTANRQTKWPPRFDPDATTPEEARHLTEWLAERAALRCARGDRPLPLDRPEWFEDHINLSRLMARR
jgi:hypothetical protein